MDSLSMQGSLLNFRNRPKRTFNAALLATSIVAIAGCFDGKSRSETPEIADAGFINGLSIQVSYLDKDSNMLLDFAPNGNVLLTFPWIAGHLWGYTSEESIVTLSLHEGEMKEIPLSAGAFTSDLQPEEISEQAVMDGLAIDPTETKFGRLGTLADFESNQDLQGYYSLYSELSGSQFDIIYIDRPASITGWTTTIDGNLLPIDIRVNRAGFYSIGFENVISPIDVGSEIHFVIVVDGNNLASQYQARKSGPTFTKHSSRIWGTYTVDTPSPPR